MNAHIKHGFLAQVYEPWVQFEGSEWGEQMRPLWEAYNCGTDYALRESDLDQIEEILRENIDAALEFFVDYYYDEVVEAVKKYPEAEEYWKNRAREFKVDFDEYAALVPTFMKEVGDVQQL